MNARRSGQVCAHWNAGVSARAGAELPMVDSRSADPICAETAAIAANPPATVRARVPSNAGRHPTRKRRSRMVPNRAAPRERLRDSSSRRNAASEIPPRHSFDGRTARALKRLARCGSTRPHKKSCASACAISRATSGALRCVLQVRAARAARDSRRGCANRQEGHFAGAAECRNALIHRECLAYPERPTVRDISHIA